ncbi:aBC transport system ATP-binding protein [Clostridium sp. CAG:354]|jgi:ABC-2 type transport system ATP-binding protein|nr:ABC transporter ATP-binding protein [Clostridium sp.]MBS5864129.1 ABC transporter ATP-binding protein [Clostridium sp.]MEE0268914.1 ABC transporter ATP-binding protein [Clostridia bacterium]CDE09866.1 aBC transport system ATP-binding protein [Clostridium sp. CAG:354]
MEATIKVKNLNKKYEGFELKNISFEIPEGSIVGLIGENGAGKTTTIKSILNIIKSEGEIQVFGKNIKQNEKEIKSKLGVVLDDSFLSEYLTPKKINSIMKNFYNTWDKKLFENYIKIFKLPENKMIKDFSSGMKMKLKIATAISHKPQILILDEPTSGLDPIVRNEILDIFRQFIAEDEKRSILISTHITTDLEHISDYIMFIKNGEITLNLPTSEILENYGIIKCDEKDFSKIAKEDYEYYRKEKYQYEVLVNNKKMIKSKYGISTIDKASIEDIMLFYIKGEK